MKIAVTFLLVAVSCCFNVASANCMDICAQSCWQPHANDINCLTMALNRNPLPTINAMVKFTCAYDRCKAMKNKTELGKSIVNLRVVTQCPLLNLLRKDSTSAEANANVDDNVKYTLKDVVDLLSGLNIGYLTTPCGKLEPLLTKLNNILHILGVPKLDGQIQNVAAEAPGLIHKLLNLILGGPGCADGGKTGLLSSLIGGNSDTSRGGSGLLSSLIGGNSDTSRGGSGLLGSLIGVSSNTDGGDTRFIGDSTDNDFAREMYSKKGAVPNMLGGIMKTVKELTNTLEDVASEDIPEITDDAVKTVKSVIGGLPVPNKSGFYKTESIVNENSLGNGGIPTGRNVGGAMSGRVDGRYSANSDNQGKGVLAAQQNTDAEFSGRNRQWGS